MTTEWDLTEVVDLGCGHQKRFGDMTAEDLDWAAERLRRLTARREATASAIKDATAADRRGDKDARHAALARWLCEEEVEPGVWCDQRAIAGVPRDPGSFRCSRHMPRGD